MITYRTGNDLDVDAVIALYNASTLGERRPVANREKFEQMLRHANLVISAWDDEQLVGIARSFTDYSFVTYLSCLVVRDTHQRHGIGKELMRRTQLAAGDDVRIVLLSAPQAVNYYPHVGFTQHMSAWTLGPNEKLK
jgi:predicted N-acetyltransferase YhbS